MILFKQKQGRHQEPQTDVSVIELFTNYSGKILTKMLEKTLDETQRPRRAEVYTQPRDTAIER